MLDKKIWKPLKWQTAMLITLPYVISGAVYSYYINIHSVTEGFWYYFLAPTCIIPSYIFFFERNPLPYIIVYEIFAWGILSLLVWIIFKLITAFNPNH